MNSIRCWFTLGVLHHMGFKVLTMLVYMCQSLTLAIRVIYE